MDKTREMLIFGSFYEFGCRTQKIVRNEDKAVEYFKNAHELGHPRGSYKV
jgi:hypothetical protein